MTYCIVLTIYFIFVLSFTNNCVTLVEYRVTSTFKKVHNNDNIFFSFQQMFVNNSLPFVSPISLFSSAVLISSSSTSTSFGLSMTFFSKFPLVSFS